MLNLLFRHNGELQTVAIYNISTDCKKIEASTKENEYGARWFDMQDFVKQYELIGTVKEFTEKDIGELKRKED